MGQCDIILMSKYTHEPYYKPTPINAFGDVDEYVPAASGNTKRKEISPIKKNDNNKKKKTDDDMDDSEDEVLAQITDPLEVVSNTFFNE